MSNGAGSVRGACLRALGCDLRSLAALRIAMGLLLLAGLALRLPEFHEHYTDSGAWPLAAARGDAGHWSLSLFSGSAHWAGALFGISALAALALTVGWFTRTATVVSWVLLLSLHARNSLMLNGGDVLLRLLLFWGMLLPLGARWSLDARRARSLAENTPPTSAPPTLVSAGTVALLVQVALVYVFNALYKTDPCWLADGTAITETLHLETYHTPWGRALLDMPGLLSAGTRVVWWLELLGPFLLFIPWRPAAFRLAAVGLFMGFHLSLFCTIRIGLFPLVGMAAWLPFIPGAFWDWLSRKHRYDRPIATQPIPLQVVQSAALALVVSVNLAGYFAKPGPHSFYSEVTAAARPFRLDQKWQLFAPKPLHHEGWYVAVLECDDNEYDAFTGQEINWLRPASLAAWYPSVNWRKFLWDLRIGDPHRARWLCAWLRSRWEKDHPGKKVNRIRLHYLWEATARRQSPPGNQLIYEDPEGPMTAQFRSISKPTDAAERSDN